MVIAISSYKKMAPWGPISSRYKSADRILTGKFILCAENEPIFFLHIIRKAMSYFFFSLSLSLSLSFTLFVLSGTFFTRRLSDFSSFFPLCCFEKVFDPRSSCGFSLFFEEIYRSPWRKKMHFNHIYGLILRIVFARESALSDPLSIRLGGFGLEIPIKIRTFDVKSL